MEDVQEEEEEEEEEDEGERGPGERGGEAGEEGREGPDPPAPPSPAPSLPAPPTLPLGPAPPPPRPVPGSAATKESLRVVVVGDAGVGKTALITTRLRNSFSQHLPAVLKPVVVKGEEGGGPTLSVVDTSSDPAHRATTVKQLLWADVVLLVCAFDSEESLRRVRSYWFRLFEDLAIDAPVVVVVNKSDIIGTPVRVAPAAAEPAAEADVSPLRADAGTVASMPSTAEASSTSSSSSSSASSSSASSSAAAAAAAPSSAPASGLASVPHGSLAYMSLLADMRVETCCECSARTLAHVDLAFSLTHRCLVYPVRPLYSGAARALSPPFVRVLDRIFRLFDRDFDSLLSDSELAEFLLQSFGGRPDAAALAGVKAVLRRQSPGAVVGGRLSFSGFLFLVRSMIEQRKTLEVWRMLTRFGYDQSLSLPDSSLGAPPYLEADQTCDLSPDAADFLRRVFAQYDRDGDGQLSSVARPDADATGGVAPSEIEDAFSSAGLIPWPRAFTASVPTGEAGHVDAGGWLAQWSRMAAFQPVFALRHLAYLGYPADRLPRAVVPNRSKREESRDARVSRRTVYCLVYGASRAGKAAVVSGLLGRPPVARAAGAGGAGDAAAAGSEAGDAASSAAASSSVSAASSAAAGGAQAGADGGGGGGGGGEDAAAAPALPPGPVVAGVVPGGRVLVVRTVPDDARTVGETLSPVAERERQERERYGGGAADGALGPDAPPTPVYDIKASEAEPVCMGDGSDDSVLAEASRADLVCIVYDEADPHTLDYADELVPRLPSHIPCVLVGTRVAVAPPAGEEDGAAAEDAGPGVVTAAQWSEMAATAAARAPALAGSKAALYGVRRRTALLRPGCTEPLGGLAALYEGLVEDALNPGSTRPQTPFRRRLKRLARAVPVALLAGAAAFVAMWAAGKAPEERVAAAWTSLSRAVWGGGPTSLALAAPESEGAPPPPPPPAMDLAPAAARV